MPSLSKIGDLSCVTSCLVLPGFLMDTLLSIEKRLYLKVSQLLLSLKVAPGQYRGYEYGIFNVT